jgi:ferredoxin
MSVAIGASATGARNYTATASQGVLFMVDALLHNCYGVSPDNAVTKLDAPGPRRYAIDYDCCKGCGLWVAECPSGADHPGAQPPAAAARTRRARRRGTTESGMDDEPTRTEIPVPAEWGPRQRILGRFPEVEPDVILHGWCPAHGLPRQRPFRLAQPPRRRPPVTPRTLDKDHRGRG